MSEFDWRAIRGPLPSRRMSARTTAALLDNPGCVRRNVLDAAGIDIAHMAGAMGAAPQFGQSPFALGQGNRFEARVKENGYEALVEVLRSVGFDLPDELSAVQITAAPSVDMMEMRAEKTRDVLARIATGADNAPNVIDHGVTVLRVGSSRVYLEQDALAFRQGDRLRICEMKGFPIVDGSAEPEKVGAAARQSAVYLASLQDTLADMAFDPAIVSHEVVLICPRNYTIRPTAEIVDVNRELRSLRRQLGRRGVIDNQISSLDLKALANSSGRTDEGQATRLVARLPNRFVPECLSRCDLVRVCRAEAEAASEPGMLGAEVENLLAGVGNLETAVQLARGSDPTDGQVEVAEVLRRAHRARKAALRWSQGS